MVATLCWLQSNNLSFSNFIAGYYYSMGIINLTDYFLTALLEYINNSDRSIRVFQSFYRKQSERVQ